MPARPSPAHRLRPFVERNAVLAFRCFVLVFAGLAIALKLHGSSSALWNREASLQTAQSPLFGQPRGIRFDEYVVSTPLVLAQCRSPEFFPRMNRNVSGEGGNMLLTTPACPVWDWTAVGQFHNWGYFLFGFERGLSWNWVVRYAGIVLFAFEFFLIWTGGNRLISALAGLSFALGAPTQWWDTSVPYILLYFFAVPVFVHRIFSASSMPGKLACGGGLVVSLLSFVYSFYPPLQMPVAVVMAVMACRFAQLGTKGQWNRPAVTLLCLALLACTANIVYMVSVNAETLANIRASVFPGQRFERGGSWPVLERLLGYAFIDLLTPYFHFNYKEAGGNPCTFSVFFAPWLVLLAACWRCRRTSWENIVLAVLAAVLVLWCGVRFSRNMAAATGLKMLPAPRAIVVASFLLLLMTFKTFDALCKEAAKPPRRRTLALVFLNVVAVAVILAARPWSRGYVLQVARSGHAWFLALCVASMLAAIHGFAFRRIWLFASGMLILSMITGGYVHPLFRGERTLTQNRTRRALEAIEQKHGPGLWACGSFRTAQYLLSQGFACLNGTQQHFNRKLWSRVDPDGTYFADYARYGHVSIRLGDKVDFEAKANRPNADYFLILLGREPARQLNVRYLVCERPVSGYDWLEPVGHNQLGHIYRVTD